jgi:hypothetical protein
MSTFFVGTKFGQEFNPDNLVSGTVSAGATLDVEVRMETANNLTRHGTVLALEQIIAWIEGGGQDGAGANMPPT